MKLIRSSRLLALAGLFAASGAFAATFTVTSGSDNGAGTLRQAIIDANANPGADNIVITATSISLATALQQIVQPVTITGLGARSTIVNGANNARIFDINNASGDVVIEKLSIRGGAGTFSGDGAGIHAVGLGTLRLLQVAVENNRATLSGGGLYTESATEIKQSTFSGNAAGSGGAIAVKTPQSQTLAGTSPAASVYIENSTISGNSSSTIGAAIDVQAASTTVTTRFSTIAFNTGAAGSAGGIGLNISGSGAGYSLTATLLASNLDGASADRNCGCSFVACNFATSSAGGGRNIETGSTCGLGSTNNVSNANASGLIDALDYYDISTDEPGPTVQTRTHRIPAGSPARDYALPGDCAATDQRGQSRPTESDGLGNKGCEVGAFETKEVVAVAVGGGGSSGGGSSGGGGGGGGGCTVSPQSSDPLMPALALIGLAGLWYRARRK